VTQILGPVEVANTIKAKNNLTFPVVEDTDIWGGFQVVATTTERDSIPSGKLKVGMRVVVQADGFVYKLMSVSPMTWAIDFGGGAADGDKGDITVSGTGTVWTIDATVVTNAKLANVAASTFKGRTTAGSGSPEDLTGTQATALLDVFTTSLKGLAPASGGGTSNYLRADGTWATPPDTSVTDGDKGDITVSGSGATWTIDAAVVTNSKLANVATATFKGRTTAGSGSPEDLTGTQATALLDVFSSTLKGLAPASGGGTSNYLRADGTWTTVAASSISGTLGVANGGTGTSTAFTQGSVVFAGASGVYSQDNSNLFWDDTNNRLGIGTATLSASLVVNNQTSTAPIFLALDNGGGGSSGAGVVTIADGVDVASGVASGRLLIDNGAGTATNTRQVSLWTQNHAIGTGTSPTDLLGSNLQANYAMFYYTAGATGGYNIGASGYSSNSSTRNIGVIGMASARTSGGAATDAIGVYGKAGQHTGGATGARVAGMFTLYDTDAIGTLTDAALIVDNADKSAPIFLARDNGATTFSIGDNGVVLAKNTLDSTAAFQVQNAAGTTVLDVDTTNGRVGVGTATPSTPLHVRGTVAGDLASRVENTDASGAASVQATNNSGAATFVNAYGSTNASNIWNGQAAASWAGVGSFNTTGIAFTAGGSAGRRMAWATYASSEGTINLRAEIEAGGAFVVNPIGDTITDFRVASDVNANMLLVDASANAVGIGTATPASALSVGATSQFQVNATGNLTKVNNVTYSFPSSQATVAGQMLTNDSSGNLTWTTPPNVASTGFADGSVTSPSIFFAADTDTGIYRPTTNQLAIATAGVQRLLIKDTEAVFNDGDFAYNFRVAGDADLNALFLQASTDRVGIGTSSPTAKLNVQAGTLASAVPAFAVTGTLSSVAATQRGVTMFITGAGSGSQQIEGLIAGISGSGYTGTATSIGANIYNESVGTGNQSFAQTFGNIAVRGQAYGASATGHNVGFYATAQNALRNFGFISVQNANSQTNGYNVGVATSAHNGASGGVRVGGFFSINTTFLPAEPTLTNAALIADNTSAPDPIFIARDNGTPVFTIADGGAVTATSTITASNLSGTNTGDQTITLTSDVTGSGTGSFATTIAAGVVSNAKLANVATATIKGRTTAGTGSPEDLTGTQATALLDVFSSTLKGLAPSSGGGTANFLRADGTWAAPPDVATSGFALGTAAAPSIFFTGDTNTGIFSSGADNVNISTGGTSRLSISTTAAAFAVSLSANNLSGTNTGDQTITLTSDVTGSGTGSFATTIAAGVVSNSKLANVATATIKGRTTAGSGSPEDLTGTQATALLDVFSSTLKGLAPASGGGTANFLRADGSWIVPQALKTPISTKTANYTITTADGTIIVNAASGPVTITLPSAASATEYHFTVKKVDTSSNTVTIAGTIDGTTNYVLYSQYEAVRVQSDGSVYWII